MALSSISKFDFQDTLRTEATETKKASTTAGAGFEGELRSALQQFSGDTLSEEELFAGVIQAQIATTESVEAAGRYADLFSLKRGAHTRRDGFVGVEAAAKAALKALTKEGGLTSESSLSIEEFAFRRAQLDDNHDKLYDSRGGPGDITVAVASREDAVKAALKDTASGDSSTAPPVTDTETDTETEIEPGTGDTAQEVAGEREFTPTGTTFDGADGFLFKPESDSDGRLVVLVPPSLAQRVESLMLLDSEGNTIETGASKGYANGGREHFRFEKAGGDYPENISVIATLNDGSTYTWHIPNPGERYD